MTSLHVLLVLLAGVLGADSAAPAPPVDPFTDNACVRCHRHLTGRAGEIVNLEWDNSVHRAAGVACDACHGGDATLRPEQFTSVEDYKNASHMTRNPEFLVMHNDSGQFVSAVRGRSVSYFCGRCHAEVKEKHLGSPHGDFGDPTCLYCHGQGSHKITKASHDIIDTRGRVEGGRCSPCHTEATMNAVRRVKELLTTTEQNIDASFEQYEQLEAWGYRSLELEKLTHNTAEVHSKLRRVFHSFNMREINNFAAEIEAIAERTTATSELVGELRRVQRRQSMVGVTAVVLLLCFAGLLVYYKHAFHEKH